MSFHSSTSSPFITSSSFEIDHQTSADVAEYLRGNTEQWIIFSYDKKVDSFFTVKRGPNKSSYEEFFTAMKTLPHGCGYLAIKVEGVTKHFLIQYYSSKNGEKLNELLEFDYYEAIDQIKEKVLHHHEPLSVIEFVTYSSSELNIRYVLQNKHEVFKSGSYVEHQVDLDYISTSGIEKYTQSKWDKFFNNPHKIANNHGVNDKVQDMIANHKHKYLILTHNPATNIVQVEKASGPNATHKDFMTDYSKAKANTVYLYLYNMNIGGERF